MSLAPAVDGDITQLPRQWGSGHDAAFRKLLSTTCQQLRPIAARIIRSVWRFLTIFTVFALAPVAALRLRSERRPARTT
jgi:hypothetical protein